MPTPAQGRCPCHPRQHPEAAPAEGCPSARHSWDWGRQSQSHGMLGTARHSSALHGSAWHGAPQDSLAQPGTAQRGLAQLSDTVPTGLCPASPLPVPSLAPCALSHRCLGTGQGGCSAPLATCLPPAPWARGHGHPQSQPGARGMCQLPSACSIAPAQQALLRGIFLAAHVHRGFPGLLAVPGAGHASSALLALGAAGQRASSGTSTGTSSGTSSGTVQVCWSTQGRAPSPSSGAGCARCPGIAAIPSPCRGFPPGSQALAVPPLAPVPALFFQHSGSPRPSTFLPARGHRQSTAPPAPHIQQTLPRLSCAPGTSRALSRDHRDRHLGPETSQHGIYPFGSQKLPKRICNLLRVKVRQLCLSPRPCLFPWPTHHPGLVCHPSVLSCRNEDWGHRVNLGGTKGTFPLGLQHPEEPAPPLTLNSVWQKPGATWPPCKNGATEAPQWHWDTPWIRRDKPRMSSAPGALSQSTP